MNLSTARSEPPSVEFLTPTDNHPLVRLRFTSSALRDGRQSALLTFSSVLHFHWGDFDLAWPLYHVDDVEFALIQITDSVLIDDWARRDLSSHPPSRFGGGVDWSQVRHYRITFDDHGTYDIVCFDLEVSFRPDDG